MQNPATKKESLVASLAWDVIEYLDINILALEFIVQAETALRMVFLK